MSDYYPRQRYRTFFHFLEYSSTYHKHKTLAFPVVQYFCANTSVFEDYESGMPAVFIECLLGIRGGLFDNMENTPQWFRPFRSLADEFPHARS